MKKLYYTIKDITKITGITRRTLHYYDEINLLKPTSSLQNGYRLYDVKDFEKLQIILFLKEMDLSLKEISGVLQLSKEEQNKVLKNHYKVLLNKKIKLERTMLSLDQYLSGKNIYDLDVFKDTKILPLKEQYQLEAKVAYGETEKYKEYETSIAKLTKDEKDKLFAEFDENMKEIFTLFGTLINYSPTSEKVQFLVKRWADSFQKFFIDDSEILMCIANTYKYDNRFKDYINQFSDKDLSDFIYKSIVYFCSNM